MIGQSKRQKFQQKSIVRQYQSKDAGPLIDSYRHKGDLIKKQSEARVLELFHLAAERVPAYKDFLHNNNIQHKKIKSIRDFRNVPIVDKKNYLRAYKLADLSWDGQIAPNYILSSSSGSTGQPFLWPRGPLQDLEGSLTYETIFGHIFDLKKTHTLYVNCFAMGTWIAGPFVLACAELLSQKEDYDILTITPGIDREVAYSLLKQLTTSFDQIVISGYPPFVKDMLDGGENHGLNWKKYNIKFLFAAEGFSDEWRSYIHSMVGSKDALHTSINMYGSADAAILSHETPLSIAIRQYLVGAQKNEVLFQTGRIPTLTQYDPRLKYFEEVEGSVIFSTEAGIPLLRYAIGDEGGVLSYNEMMSSTKSLGFSPREHLSHRDVWQLPFVYVFGRSDFTVSLYGLLVYPEHIKFGLEKPDLMSRITGKFVISIEQDEHFDPYLLVRVELAAGVKPSKKLELRLKKSIFEGLMAVNSEYARLRQELGNVVLPTVELVEQGNQEYFKQGAKQRWVKKDN